MRQIFSSGKPQIVYLCEPKRTGQRSVPQRHPSWGKLRRWTQADVESFHLRRGRQMASDRAMHTRFEVYLCFLRTFNIFTSFFICCSFFNTNSWSKRLVWAKLNFLNEYILIVVNYLNKSRNKIVCKMLILRRCV